MINNVKNLKALVPDNGPLRDLAESVSVVEQALLANYKEEAVQVFYEFVDPDSEKKYFLICTNTNYKITALRDSVKEKLRAMRHEVSDSIANSILGVMARIDSSESRISKLNSLLGLVSDCHVSSYCLLTFGQNDLCGLKFGEYSFENSGTTSFWSRHRKTGSPLQFEAVNNPGDNPDGVLFLERNYIDFRCINIQKILGRTECYSDDIIGALTREYFRSLSLVVIDKFWNAFHESQSIAVALGYPIIRKEELERRSNLLMKYFLVYLNIGERKDSYMSMIGMVRQGVLPIQANSQAKKLRETTLATIGVDPFSPGSLPPEVINYVSLVRRAEEHLLGNRSNEAYLHYVMAIELLLTDGKTEVTRLVTTRAAVICCSELGLTYLEQVRRLEKIYQIRSEYVHLAKDIGEPTTQIQALAQVILVVLLRWAKHAKETDFNNWKLRLDHLVTAFKAGIIPPKELLESVGLLASSPDQFKKTG